LKIIDKIGSDISIIALPSEEVSIGEYLIIEDEKQKSGLIVQICEERYLDHSGQIENIVRDEIMNASTVGVDGDPLQISTISDLILDIRLLKCKIRGSTSYGRFTPNATILPSRVKAKIKKMQISELMQIAGQFGSRKIELGKANEIETLQIFAESLDGRLNILTGKKESGKSHLAKLLASNLVKYGAYVFIFDLNNEYIGLGRNTNGTFNSNFEKNIILSPGDSLAFSLQYLGLSCILSLLNHILDIPGASLREFIRMWKTLESQGSLSLKSLENLIKTSPCNEFIRDALISRFRTLISSGLFSDEKSIKIEDIFFQNNNGGLIIISLYQVSPLVRKMIVEIFLSKIVNLLEQKKIPPIFLFAEEAHLYLRETYWDDIITRMRHFGIFTTFITNQPDAIDDGIFRQVDNVFLFNFTNDNDLEKIARASMIDTESVKSMVRNLPQRSCLALGKVVANLPVIVEVSKMETLTFGETRKFFKADREICSIQTHN
jgi:hypothetical protein